MNPEIFQQLILAVALALVSLLSWAARELFQIGIAYLKVRLGQANYDRVRQYTRDVVRSIEQSPIYKDFEGAKKFELAKVAVLQYAEANSLPIDGPLFDKFIEAAVQEMNSQMSQIDWVAGEILSSPDLPALGGLS